MNISGDDKINVVDETNNTNKVNNISSSKFYKNIKYLRESLFLSQETIGKVVNKERSLVSLWERNDRNPSVEDLINLSIYFKVSIDDLVKRDLEIEKQKQDLNDKLDGSKIPVYSRIPYDIPLDDVKAIGWEEIPKSWLKQNKKYFGFKITDSSMAPNYNYDDIVIFEKTDKYDYDKDYLVIVDNNNAVFRRIIKQPYGILLQSLNDYSLTNYYDDRDIANLKVLGVAKEIRRKLNNN